MLQCQSKPQGCGRLWCVQPLTSGRRSRICCSVKCFERRRGTFALAIFRHFAGSGSVAVFDLLLAFLAWAFFLSAANTCSSSIDAFRRVAPAVIPDRGVASWYAVSCFLQWEFQRVLHEQVLIYD